MLRISHARTQLKYHSSRLWWPELCNPRGFWLKILDSSGPDQGDEPILEQLPDSEPLVCCRGLYQGGHFVAKNSRGEG